MDAIEFRRRKASDIPSDIGVYALCDLDQVPIYVGQSRDGIRARVRRHLTSARSDVIANRQIDVWEIAYVWGWPVAAKADLDPLEAYLFHEFNDVVPLMNGSIPARPEAPPTLPNKVRVQVMENEEVKIRQDPALRLPRQVQHFGRLVDHILNVKDSAELRRSLVAHYDRLTAYYEKFLRAAED